MSLDAGPVHQHSSGDVKIRLFRSLFRGRGWRLSSQLRKQKGWPIGIFAGVR